MGITLAGQTLVFLKSILFGMLLAAFYDVFRTIRLIKNTGVIVIFICDIIYWIVCGFLTYIFILAVNFGQVRGFIIVGALLGAILYYNTIGVIVMKSMGKIIGIVKKVMNTVIKLIVKPFKLVFVFLCRIFGKTTKLIGKTSEKFEKSTKKGLKLPAKLLYNIKKKKISKTQKETDAK